MLAKSLSRGQMVGVSYENKGLEILIDILIPLPVYLKWANKCLLAQCSCHPYLTIYIFHILAHIIFRLISWGIKAVEAEPGGVLRFGLDGVCRVLKPRNPYPFLGSFWQKKVPIFMDFSQNIGPLFVKDIFIENGIHV